jgi:hypothetical protein
MLAQNYYLFLKAMPVGNHTIEYHVIRASPGQAVENDVAHYDIKVVQ